MPGAGGSRRAFHIGCLELVRHEQGAIDVSIVSMRLLTRGSVRSNRLRPHRDCRFSVRRLCTTRGVELRAVTGLPQRLSQSWG